MTQSKKAVFAFLNSLSTGRPSCTICTNSNASSGAKVQERAGTLGSLVRDEAGNAQEHLHGIMERRNCVIEFRRAFIMYVRRKRGRCGA